VIVSILVDYKHSLMKTSRIDATAFGVLALFLTNVLPAFYLFSPKTTGTLGRMNILSTILVYAHRGKHLGEGLPWWYALLHPIGICVFIYAMLRSATTIIVNGGVEWRGTRYPLKELRASAPAP
jgi:hypothetical protein